MDAIINVLVAACVLALAMILAQRLRADTRRKRRGPAARRRHQSAPNRIGKPESALRREVAEPENVEPSTVPRLAFEEDDDLELTKLTLGADKESEPDPTEGQTKRFERGVIPIIYDDDAAVDEPTQASAFIIVSAGGQSDMGKKRKRNEDRLLLMDSLPLYVVADGMGGHAGGDVASTLATDVIEECFKEPVFDEKQYEGVPRRGRELVQAIQLANRRIFDLTIASPELKGMGTTIVAARFSPNKQRVYIGHVGDSRCYLLRDGELRQITDDHVAGAQGYKGKVSGRLTRALGVKKSVIVDLILGKPKPGDRYILCSDGLPKMVTEARITELLLAYPHPADAVPRLIEAANQAGGKDNTTVIGIRIDTIRPR